MMKYRTDFSVKVEKKNVLVKFLILSYSNYIFLCIVLDPSLIWTYFR